VKSSDEVGVLATAFNRMTSQLREMLGGLEQRVTDLTLVADVGRSLSQVRDLNILLADAVELIRSRFDLYYTQIYLTESNGRALLMRAGTGPVGEELHRRGLRLPFGAGSLNGTAAAERRTVIVGDTSAAFSFRPNPLLPDTRSEMCVPLLSGDQVLGVLDLQSAHSGAFSEDHLSVFEALAAQLAVAIQNAELFAVTEQARTEIEQQTRRTARAGWQAFLNAIQRHEQIGYTYAGASLTPLTAPSALALAEPDQPLLTTPVLVSGEPVGELRLEGDADSAWAADEQELVNAVSRQVAQQLENLRLLAQAEDYQHQAEDALRRLTREGWEEQTVSSAGYQYDLHQQVVSLTDTWLGPEPGTVELTQPLTVRGEAIGELALTGVEAMDDETAELVSAVADKLSAHIENLRLFEQTQSAFVETQTLFQISTQLSAAATLEEVLRAIAQAGANTGLASAGLRLYTHNAAGQPEWQEMRARWLRDPQSPLWEMMPVGARLLIARFPFAQLITQATEPILCNDLLTDDRVDEPSRASLQQFGTRAAVFLPLTYGPQRLGDIRLTWDTAREFTAPEKRLYTALTGQASIAVNSQLLFEQTQKRADREAIINTINQKIQGATSVEGALQIAAREIGQKLKTRRMVVEIAGARPDNNQKKPLE